MTEEVTPKRIGDYEILAVLGTGGMGRVFKVRNVISDRVEAMKILLPDLAGRQELAERFLREIKVLASLNHPNIAGLRTALTLENRLVMVMEYVEGTTLAARLEQGPIPAADALNYIDQVLDALKYAHEQKVIHRDIKPSNMMLTPQGIVKLMDFGIARSGTDHSLTSTGTTLGSLYYMSPEQVRGEGTDARSDLYSVGVSLYEMVTGQRPFQADSDFSVMAAHLQQQPKPPLELRSDLPEGLNEIILIAMSKDPGQRFQSATAFRAALRNVRTSLPAAIAARSGTVASASPLGATGVLQSIPSAGSQTGLATSPVRIGSEPQIPLQPPPTAPQPVPSVLELSAQQKSHRGLYMAFGALIVVGVLIAAGLYIPKRSKAKADSEQTTSTQAAGNGSGNNNPAPTSAKEAGAAPTSSDMAASTASTSVNPADRGTAPTGSPATGAGSTEAQPPIVADDNPARKTPASPKGGTNGPLVPAGKKSGIHSLSKTKQLAGSGIASPGTATGSAESSALPNTANGDQIAELEQQAVQLSSRTNAVNDSLNHLRQQQSAQGLGLRGDISASQERLGMHMAKAQSALQNGDLESAKKYLDLAEGEIGKLEKFLGH